MGNYRRGPPGPQLSLPPLAPWLRNVLLAVLGLFVVEMVLVYGIGLSIYSAVAWSPDLPMSLTEPVVINPQALAIGTQYVPGAGPSISDLWQPITQLLVQGPNVGSLLMVGLVTYFFLPHVIDRYTPKQLTQAAAAAVLGCIPAGWLWAIICFGLVQVGFERGASWLTTPGMGLTPLALGTMVLFALGRPDAQVQMMFVLPLKAKHLVWLVLGFAALGFLLAPGAHSFQYFGAVGAVVAWFELMGPGGSKRRYRQAGRDIEKQLNFKVYEGGKQDSQGGGDKWIN